MCSLHHPPNRLTLCLRSLFINASLTIGTYMQEARQSYSTAEVAALAGVHRDTLLRWLRAQTVSEPHRDRRGWRAFAPEDAARIIAFAKKDQRQVARALPIDDTAAISRLEAIEWDFAAAKTSYLTHNLHPYPAKFIPQIPNALVQELSSVGETVADIFCGSGTTLLEALQLKRHAIGIDANPLATLISKAKTTPLTESALNELENHRLVCQELLPRAEALTGNLFHDRQPFSSMAWRPESSVCEFWFQPHVVEELAELRSLIDQIPTDSAKQLCAVTFSAIIVAVSKQDSDTRYVRREKVVKEGDTIRRYLKQLNSAISAAREMSDLVENRFSCEVLNADILQAPHTQLFDLVVTSPPYPNAYSYHLYHRTRLLWMRCDPDSFKRIEIGSHRKYSSKGRNRATQETFRKEFEKILCWLRERLRDRRYACFVIGDSTINGARIDNSALLVAAGAKAGFREVKRINRVIASTRKAFNPRIGKIKNENILILQKM